MSQRKVVKRTMVSPHTAKIMRAEVRDESEFQPAEYKVLFAPQRYLVYSQFKGQFNVHVREYAHTSLSKGMGECEYPTMKGVCFTPGRLTVLRNKMDEIDEHLKKREAPYKTHLGAGIYASVDKLNGVDLRRYWIPEGQLEIVPTKRGIYLPSAQWTSLKENIAELLEVYPELATAEECFHNGQLELIECRECLPFGWMMA